MIRRTYVNAAGEIVDGVFSTPTTRVGDKDGFGGVWSGTRWEPDPDWDPWATPKRIFADNPDTNAARWDGVQWTPYPDPIRPPETDEEPWPHPRLGVVSVRGDDTRPSASDILFVIALAVIVAILVAWAVR